MQSFKASIEINADRHCIWCALTKPEEVIRWDTGLQAPIDVPPDYPKPGQRVRWRYRLGPFPLTLYDRPQRVDPMTLLTIAIRLGPLNIEETYTLQNSGSGFTLLSADLSLCWRHKLTAVLFEPVFGLPLARSTVQTSLQAIKQYCERQSSEEL